MDSRDAVDVPGFVSTGEVEELLGRALCMLLPSRREGYGLVVIEAAARGTPSIVVAGPDNAAVELISEGENGFVAPSAAPQDLAAAIVRVCHAGSGAATSTADWFAANAQRLSLGHSLEVVLEAYGARADCRVKCPLVTGQGAGGGRRPAELRCALAPRRGEPLGLAPGLRAGARSRR